jgi:thiol-disulfide isomerase/thioredoxin
MIFLGIWMKRNIKTKTLWREIVFVCVPFLLFWITVFLSKTSLAEQFLIIGFIYFLFGFFYKNTYFTTKIIPLLLSFLFFLIPYGGESLYNYQPDSLPVIFVCFLAILVGYTVKYWLTLPRYPQRILAGSMVLFFVLFLYNGMAYGMPNWLSYIQNTHSKVKYIAPVFKMLAQGSTSYTNEHFIGKTVVFDLWTTTCGVCFEKFPAYNQFYLKNAENKDLLIYAVHVPTSTDTPEKIQKTIQKQINQKGYKFPLLTLGNNRTVFEKNFNYKGYPQVIVIDKNGYVRYGGSLNLESYIKINNLNDIIQDLLKD